MQRFTHTNSQMQPPSPTPIGHVTTVCLIRQSSEQQRMKPRATLAGWTVLFLVCVGFGVFSAGWGKVESGCQCGQHRHLTRTNCCFDNNFIWRFQFVQLLVEIAFEMCNAQGLSETETT